MESLVVLTARVVYLLYEAVGMEDAECREYKIRTKYGQGDDLSLEVVQYRSSIGSKIIVIAILITVQRTLQSVQC